MPIRLRLDVSLALAALVALAGCSGFQGFPGAGFVRSDLDKKIEDQQAARQAASIELIDVTDAIARRLLANETRSLFSETFGNVPNEGQLIGVGDVLEVAVWEAPPAVLFSNPAMDPRSVGASSRVVIVSDQIVDRAGTINVPFAGPVKAAGRTLSEIEADITRSLTGKANQPQVVARLVRNVSSNVTVVGEVAASAVVPLTARGERLLDAIAAAGGVRQPVGKITIQLSRGGRVEALPLDTIIRDPRQNVPLRPADVVTALFQPFSFIALGAMGKNEEINFETQGITLAQALARSGGLIDPRSDPKGVFIFRFEPKTALPWAREPVTTPDGKVPVVYRIDLKDPASFFIAQNFPMSNRDVLYVSNAPVAETQKFLNLLFSVVYPLTATTSVITR